MIPFNLPPRTGQELEYIKEALNSDKISGDGEFSQRCHHWLEAHFQCRKALLTPSCTHALEMAALLLDIKPGDEVLMPSYTFVSTANAFVLRGADIVFVDIRPDTMNIDETLIEAAITDRTRAIVVVHYAGISCEMDTILDISQKYDIAVIEDAAQAIMSSYKGQPVGSLGDMSTISFHETKNFTSGGEGGALIINDPRYASRAEIIREKGTNRSEFFRGMVDKYTWVDMGSSYLPSELQAAYLLAQFDSSDIIIADRLLSWELYLAGLSDLQEAGLIELPHVPDECDHNGHMFYLKCRDIQERTELLMHFKMQDILGVFHYVPLHSSPAGQKYGRFHGEDRYTSRESERLIRLPMWYGMPAQITQAVINAVRSFYSMPLI